jgi:SAM-dependent methyltransferase
VTDADTAFADLLPGLLGSRPLGDILHVGCGSGELLRLLLPEARMAVGTEPSGHRRQVARAHLRQVRPPRWTIRDALPAQLPFEAGAFDLVIVQDALSAGPENGEERQKILGEAARVLRPAGRLLILERILPTDGELSVRLAALGFAVTRRQWLPGRTPDRALFLASRLASRPDATHARTGTDD